MQNLLSICAWLYSNAYLNLCVFSIANPILDLTEVPTLNKTAVPIEPCIYTHKIYLCNASSVAIEYTKNNTVINYVWLSIGVKQAFVYSTEEFRNLDCSHDESFVGGTSESEPFCVCNLILHFNNFSFYLGRVNGIHNKEVKRKIIANCRKDCGRLVARMLYKVDEDPCKSQS